MDDSDMLNQRHGWSPQSAPFQGGLTRPVSQFSIIPDVKYDLNPSFCSWVMVFNNGVSAEHHDVTVKMTFDLYDVKCQHVITLSCQTLVWGFVVISVWILKLQRKCVLRGHCDLWPFRIWSVHPRVQRDVCARYKDIRYHVHEMEGEKWTDG